ncbi:hypothetical protein CDIK_3788, partial [Cucumispora dikerogammari]
KQRPPEKLTTEIKRVRNAEASETSRKSNTERDSAFLTKSNIYTANIFSPKTHMSSLSNTISKINPPIQANRISPLRPPKNLNTKQTNNPQIPIFVDNAEWFIRQYPASKGLSKDNIFLPSVIDTDKKVDSSEFDEFFPFKIENDPNVTSDSAKKKFIVYYTKKLLDQVSQEISDNITDENNEEYTFKIETSDFKENQGGNFFYIDISFYDLPVFMEPNIVKSKVDNCYIEEDTNSKKKFFFKKHYTIRVLVEKSDGGIQTKIRDVLPSFKLDVEKFLFINDYAKKIREWDYPQCLEETISSISMNSIKETQAVAGKNTKNQGKTVAPGRKQSHQIGCFLNTYILSEKDTLFKHEKSRITCKIIKKLHALKEHLKTMHVGRRTEETPRSFLKKKINEIYFFYQQFSSDSKDIINHTENKDDIQEQVFIAIYEKIYNNMSERLPNMFISYNEYLRDPNEEKLEEKVLK